MQYHEHVYDGLANADEAIFAVKNTAQAVVHVADG